MAEFSIVKKGYDPDEVNEYIGKLEEIIKSYKEKDAAIKNAIVSAQVAADNIIKNAELEAMSRKYKTIEMFNALQVDINKQKSIVKTFQADYNNLIRKYLLEFNDVEFLQLFGTLNTLEENIVMSTNKLSGKKVEPVIQSEPIETVQPVNDNPINDNFNERNELLSNNNNDNNNNSNSNIQNFQNINRNNNNQNNQNNQNNNSKITARSSNYRNNNYNNNNNQNRNNNNQNNQNRNNNNQNNNQNNNNNNNNN